MITQFLKEDNGNFSSMRFLVIFIVVVQMLVWAGMCFKNGQIISWDYQDMSVIGVALGAKVWSKGKESK